MEQELVKAILNGESQRYTEIVRQYKDIVANLCYKIAGADIDIEEVSQMVFVELYTSLSRFRFDSKLSTYIYKITVNTISKKLKKEKRYIRIDTTKIPQAYGVASIETNLIQNDQVKMLQNAIRMLKYEQRVAITLFYYEELSYKEISETMNVSLSKTESLIFRAKQNLRKILAKQI